ncbi:hypothetical protein [Natrarchaeobius oligotrophus]|uniref:Uncharacterized protein n=1 Tax=Natrarchaeobius chitinivorans TaxID=1679083 RepID=A0A3N6N0H9_NATCH|nr:hypothetical protein [Natrarchaeobius chitinivorans]RQH00957.1 hypothetical protein EA472_10080 [Natrarchaeobius chitinivorans]
MRRRAFIALSTATALAGCSGLLGGGVDAEIGQNERVEFSADEGAELSVSVEVTEIIQPDEDESDQERDALTFRLDHADEGVVDVWSVEDSKTFDVTIETGGTHYAMIVNGVADVTIE